MLIVLRVEVRFDIKEFLHESGQITDVGFHELELNECQINGTHLALKGYPLKSAITFVSFHFVETKGQPPHVNCTFVPMPPCMSVIVNTSIVLLSSPSRCRLSLSSYYTQPPLVQMDTCTTCVIVRQVTYYIYSCISYQRPHHLGQLPSFICHAIVHTPFHD